MMPIEPDEILQGLVRRLDGRACLPGRLLERLVVGALPAAEAADTMAHVASCLICLNTFTRLQSLHAMDAPRPRLIGGVSPFARALPSVLSRLAEMDEGPGAPPVLVAGEVGTGKGVVAHEIHAVSRRASGAFIEVKCTAMPAERLVRELPGLIEVAAGGTLFLDEVDALSPEAQARLLAALETRAVDVRIIVATHTDLDAAVRAGAFRADLRARFAAAMLLLPPLRERVEDIVPLARQFAARHGGDRRLTPDAEDRLRRYTWPGNIRELADVIARAGRDREEIGAEALDLPRA